MRYAVRIRIRICAIMQILNTQYAFKTRKRNDFTTQLKPVLWYMQYAYTLSARSNAIIKYTIYCHYSEMQCFSYALKNLRGSQNTCKLHTIAPAPSCSTFDL